jgi:DUF1365 family protein
MQMEADYAWSLNHPGSQLTVSLADVIGNEKIFDVDMMLNRKPLNRGTFYRTLARYPAMSLRTTQAIYWQALQLWRKGCLFHNHP